MTRRSVPEIVHGSGVLNVLAINLTAWLVSGHPVDTFGQETDQPRRAYDRMIATAVGREVISQLHETYATF